MMKKDITAHVVSHTHWDREWYMSFQKYRMRLVNLIDSLIDIFENEKEYRHFNLDGQTICLEDYCEVYPQKKDVLKELVGAGKIAVGPWYVLPDEFLVGGESIIRNLMIGDRIAGEYGRKMQVSYLPDTFSHISQMPQICRKFGIDTALIWRGISGMPNELKSEFIWVSPDGTGIFTIHLSDGRGYFNLNDVPDDITRAAEIIDEAVRERMEFATTSHVLLMNGCDHKHPTSHTGRIIDGVDRVSDKIDIKHSSLESYAAAVKSANPELRHIEGEMTKTNQSPRGVVNFTLRNVLSSRMYIKQANYEMEKKLEKYTEPLMTMSMLDGGKYFKGFIDLAWKYLVQNHPHDSICGCSVDDVHRDMERRFSWVSDIAGQCIHESMYGIAGRIDTSVFKDGLMPVHLFNTLCYERVENSAEITVDMTDLTQRFTGFIAEDDSGNRLDCQLVSINDCVKVYSTLCEYPKWKKIREVKLIVDAGSIPAMGYKTIAIRPDNRPSIFESGIITGHDSMENEFLKVRVNANGTIDVFDKKSGKRYSGLNYFVDGGDIGDTYVYSPPLIDRVINTGTASPAISIVHNGPLMGAFNIMYELEVPEASEPNGFNRDSARYVKNTISVDVILKSGSKILEFETTVVNKAKDHRIRVMFPTGIEASKVSADGHFDVLDRDVDIEQPKSEVRIESATAAYPQKRFVDVSDGKSGVALFNQGLPEYEIVREEGCCTIALTLLRGVDRLYSDRSIAINPNNFEIEAKEAQCLGTYSYKYALYFHSHGWFESGVSYQAEKYNNPLSHYTGTIHQGTLPTEKSYFGIDNENVVVSAVKKAENRESIILRLYNPHSGAQTVSFKASSNIKRVFETNLKEERMSECAIEDVSRFAFVLKGKEIKTFEMEFDMNNKN